MMQEREELERRRQEADLGKLRADMQQDAASLATGETQQPPQQQQTPLLPPKQQDQQGQPRPAPRGRVVLDGRKGALLADIDEGDDQLLDLD